MNELFKSMNQVVADWKDRYDLSDNVSLQFSTDDNRHLCFSDRTFVFDDVPEIESATFAPEHITFYLAGNRRIYISIMWPEDEGPRVKSVLYGYVL